MTSLLETPSLVELDDDDELTQPYTVDPDAKEPPCQCPIPHDATDRLSPILLSNERSERERQLMAMEDDLSHFVLVPERRKARSPPPIRQLRPMREAKRKATKQLQTGRKRTRNV